MTTNNETTAKMKEIMRTVKAQNGAWFTADIDTLQRYFAWLMSNVFNANLKDAPVFTIAQPRNGEKPIYCTYSPDLRRIADKSATALLFTVNPAILDDSRTVAEAMCYACLHYLALLQGKKVARKKGLDFKALAEKHGLTAEKSNDVNAGYEKIGISAELWQKIFPYVQAVKFNFEGIETNGKNGKQDKKAEYYYVAPNRTDFVKSDNPALKLYVEHNGEVVRMELDEDGTLMQMVKNNRREQRKKTPVPTARQQVHK